MDQVGQAENGSCPVCKSSCSYLRLNLPNRFQLREGLIFQLHVCKNCGVYYIKNKPTEDLLAYFYPSTGYDPFITTEKNKTFYQKLYLLARSFSLWMRFQKLGKPKENFENLLDIGCGTGEFLEFSRKKGWKVYGIDYSENVEPVLQKKQIPYTLLDINQFDLFQPKEPINAITMWHSLEHTYEPKKILFHCNQLLGKNGKIIIAVPNATSWDARIYKEFWVAYDAPRHLTMFTPEVLTNVLEECNFEVKRISTLPLDLFYNVLLSEKLKKDFQNKTDWYFFIRMISALLPSLIGGPAGASVIVVIGEKIGQ